MRNGLEQLASCALQRTHTYENVIGCVPLHAPGLIASVDPTLRVPEIVGACSFRGTTWARLGSAKPPPATVSVVRIDAASAVIRSRARTEVAFMSSPSVGAYMNVRGPKEVVQGCVKSSASRRAKTAEGGRVAAAGLVILRALL